MSAFPRERRWHIAKEDRRATTVLARTLDVPRIVAHLLMMRGTATAEAGRAFLDPSSFETSDPFHLDDMSAAVDRIDTARRRGEHVLVFGDYDVDGIAGTALLVRALGQFGVRRCSYGMPVRLTEGYGISPDRIEWARGMGVDLIITVDNGTNAREAATAAAQAGIDLVVTDHHEPEGEFPQARAVVNPKRQGPSCPGFDFSGAAVAYKLACALGGPEARGMEDLDLVALGTVADIVPLRGENRALVARGLRTMAEHARPGLVALARAAGIDLTQPTAENIAFHLGPRINAGGRVGDGLTGLKLLLTDSPVEAGDLARKLNEANEERRRIEKTILEEAVREVEPAVAENRAAIVVARQGWHPGVIGVVASRLQQMYWRPVILLAIDDDGMARGSARSIPGFDMMEALGTCRPYLVRYGGHQGAAGITVAQENIGPFKETFEAAAAERLSAEALAPVLDIDALVSLSEIDGRLVRAVERLEPFGCGNPVPLFCSCGVNILAHSIRDLRGDHVRFVVQQGNRAFTVIGFRMAGCVPRDAAGGLVDIAFTPKFNTWQGETSIQLVLKDLRPA